MRSWITVALGHWLMLSGFILCLAGAMEEHWVQKVRASGERVGGRRAWTLDPRA